MNMSMIFGLEDEDPNAEAESQQSENTSSTEDEVEESEECGDDPGEATESFICESLGISPYELNYFASEESYDENVHSLEIGRLKGLADDLGWTQAGRQSNLEENAKRVRNVDTLFLHTIYKKFGSLQEAMRSPEVKRYVGFASDWRKKHGYQTVKAADAIKVEPTSFNTKNLYNIDGETIHVTRHNGGGGYYGGAKYETYFFELKILYIKNKNSDTKVKGKTNQDDLIGIYRFNDKNDIRSKGFCVVKCDNNDQSITKL